MAMCNGKPPGFPHLLSKGRTLRSWRNGGKALDFYIRNRSDLPP
jgi:hypothetical protein